MLRGIALGVSLVYGTYLIRNAVAVARILVPAVAELRHVGRVLEEGRREVAAIFGDQE